MAGEGSGWHSGMADAAPRLLQDLQHGPGEVQKPGCLSRSVRIGSVLLLMVSADPGDGPCDERLPLIERVLQGFHREDLCQPSHLLLPFVME